MNVQGPTALIAAQVYGTAAQPGREAARVAKADAAPRFTPEDRPPARAADAQGRAERRRPDAAPSPAPDRPERAFQREAPGTGRGTPQRPGTLIDIRV